MNRSVFVSVRAQEGNLGDLIIRRYVTDAAAASGAELHVLVGGVSDSFVKALQLPPSAKVYQSTWRWIWGLAEETARGRVALAFTPGPQLLAMRGREWSHLIFSALLSVLVRLGGGRVVKVGRSIEGTSRIAQWLERVVVKMAHLYTVRDAPSLGVLRSKKARLSPDVGFIARLQGSTIGDVPGQTSKPRSLIAFSFRGDREIDIPTLTALIADARTVGLEPVFVTQVRQDGHQHSEMAERFNCEHVAWREREAHAIQLERVLDAYSTSRAVISNRLHGLVFGIRCGASPIGLVSQNEDKLAKTLAAVGMDSCVFEVDGGLTLESGLSRKFETELAAVNITSARDLGALVHWLE